MCENCITMSLRAAGEQNVTCPLCKTFNEENPLDFQAVTEDMLKVNEPNLHQKRKYDCIEEDEFLKAWKQMFAGVMKRPADDSVEAVTIVQPEVIDLTEL